MLRHASPQLIGARATAKATSTPAAISDATVRRVKKRLVSDGGTSGVAGSMGASVAVTRIGSLLVAGTAQASQQRAAMWRWGTTARSSAARTARSKERSATSAWKTSPSLKLITTRGIAFQPTLPRCAEKCHSAVTGEVENRQYDGGSGDV